MRIFGRSAIAAVLVLLLAWPGGFGAGAAPTNPKTTGTPNPATQKPAPKPAPKPAQVRGVLLDSQGLPAKGYQIALKDKVGNLFMSGPSGADGAFAVNAVPPSTYRLTAFAPDGTEFPVLSKEVALKAGQMERVEIRLSGKGAAPGRADQAKSAKAPGAQKKAAAAAPPSAAKGGVPTAALVAIVVAGVFAVGALASGGGGQENLQPPVSPTLP